MPSADAAAFVDLADLGLDEGGHLLVDRGLGGLAPGQRLTVTGRHPALAIHLGAWCRSHGHRLIEGNASGGGVLEGGASGGGGSGGGGSGGTDHRVSLVRAAR
jgi:hypothetical protein